MVVVLKGSQRSEYPDYFDQLFRLRHQIFITGRGWSLPSRNGREIDQYDIDEAVYFLDVNGDGKIEGTVRITPTLRASLTADYFPHLVENGVPPRAPDIYEATRYIVLPVNKSRMSNREAKSRLLVVLTEWCMEAGLTAVQTVIDAATLRTFIEMNPGVRPMGLTCPYGGGRGTLGGGECMVIRWPTNADALDCVKAYGGQHDKAGNLAA